MRINFNAGSVFRLDNEAQVADENKPESLKLISEDGGKVREFLRKSLFDSYRDEYKEFVDTIRGVETKAQGAIAIAGIFIAGAFVLLREPSSQLLFSEKALLGFSIGFFVISVFLSVRVLKVGEAYLPPSGSSVDKIFTYCLSIEHEPELAEEMIVLLTEQKAAWMKVKDENTEIIKSKAHFLLAAQYFLQMAIVLIAVLVMFRIFGH